MQIEPIRRTKRPEHVHRASQPCLNERRNQNTGKTHCKYGHELTPTNTATDRRGHRSCRECSRRRSSERWREKRDKDRERRAEHPGPTMLERFWSKVEKSETCWLWTGHTKSGTYGQFTLFPHHQMPAHRFAYITEVGAIPNGLVLDHLCRNPRCVRPDHLEAVTQRENVLRGEGIAAKRSAQTHCVRGHEFTPENTYHPRKAPHHRACLTCIRDNNRHYYQARKLRRQESAA